MTEQLEGQMSIFEIYGQDIWSGKTCRAHFQAQEKDTQEKTSKQSSRKSQGSSAKIAPMFLYLKKASGQSQDALWVTEMTDSRFLSHTDFTIASFGECPSVAVESRLSQILEEHPHPKYSLSPRACQGILNRAERRGKELPSVLREALIRQATPSRLGGGVDVDSNGKKAGKGPLVQTELSGTLGVSQDQTLITNANVNYEMQNKVYGISSYDSNAMKSPNPHSGIYEADTSRTLDLNGGSPACNQGGIAVVQVETEVMVRKYPVDTEKLIECLQEHRTLSIKEISEKLNKPKTLVEHWFRKDKCFAIPDADVWLELKDLLGIQTNEFDESIMTFEVKPGKYDMNNRIHMGDVSPTFTASGENTVYCLEGNGSRESHKGDGFTKSDVMYTLNTVERHGIVDTYQKTTGSLCASGYDKLGTQEAANDMYVVQSCSWDGSQVSPTLTKNNAGGGQRMPDKDNFNAVVQSMEVFHCTSEEDKVQTLKARDYKDPQIVAYGVDCYNQTQTEEVSKALNSVATDSDHVPCVYGLDRASFNQGKNALYDFSVEEEKAQTLVSRGPGGVLTKQ